MNFENLKAVIDFAMEKEKEAEAFYLELCAEETMSGAKQLFSDFAKEERRHQKMLQDLGGAEMTGYKFKWITDLKRSDFVIDLEYKKGLGYREILMIAMKREEKALELYNQLQANAKEEKQQKLFKILCQEEAKHKLALETMYDDYMAKMGD
ncbi:MAG: ferritin-like domain-containing protein [Thermodesulfobacteriota bacterium]